MTKRRRGIVFGATAVILLGFCALAFVAIGYLAAQGTATFDWGAASTAATAAGTLGLAIVTGWLAYTTSVDVSATRRLADRAEQDAAERREPIVAIQGFEIGRVIPDPASPQVKWAITVILTNVGLGPALNVALSPMLKDVSDSIRFSPEMKVLSTLAPTATEKLDFELVTHAPVTVIGEENEYAFSAQAVPGAQYKLAIHPSKLWFAGGYLDRSREPKPFLDPPVPEVVPVVV
jgi:hypothetical protein